MSEQKDNRQTTKDQNAAALLAGLSKTFKGGQTLTQPQKNKIMNDFNRGAQHMLFMATLKFSFWNEIPYKLAGLAHMSESVARSIAQQCLRQWDRLSRLLDECRRQGTTPPFAHHISDLLLNDAGPLRALVVLFADGMLRADPRLKPLWKVVVKTKQK